ncbi:MAG: hypothetical protein ACRCVV_10290 [Shewanella sp.]
MNVVESSFKDLMGDIRGFADIHVRDIIIETLKNITHQSFADKNIFESPFIDKNGKVKYKYNFVTNVYQLNEFHKLFARRKVQHQEYLSGLIIPLVSPIWSVGHKARLVIVIPNYIPVPQISIQFYVDNVDKWVTVPCRTNTVKETIMNLFPQE